MGRQQYLSRLVLGRSAFAEVEDDQLAVDQDRQRAHANRDDEPPNRQHVQQYDAKGRPVNPLTNDRNAALRDAENAALALVGVVKRKDNNDRATELKFRAISSRRATVLKAENEIGKDVELAVTFLTALDYATETLIQRIQAGSYRSTDTFASIIQNGVEAMTSARLGGSVAILFPGAPAAIVHTIVRVCIGALLAKGFEELSEWLIRQKLLRKKATRLVNHALSFACEAVLIGLDVALLPLDHYAYAQRLGLAPTWPLVPDWRILLPSNPTSIHHFGWQSSITVPVLHRLCSPAALMLFQTTLWREQDGDTPVAGLFTNFRFPEHFNASTQTMYEPAAASDPLGWVLYQGYLLRTKLMRFFGYTLEHQPRSKQFESYRLPAPQHSETLAQIPDGFSASSSENGVDDGMQHVHRSTTLAHIAPRYLASRIDVAYAQLLLLPLQALVVRSVTQSYLASPLPKTSFALAAQPYLHTPFGSVGGWRALGSYLSKLGLGLSLHTANTVGTFFLVYALARWQGRCNFEWGVMGTIGGMTYPTEGEE